MDDIDFDALAVGLEADTEPVAAIALPGFLLITFKITEDGERGHPMDHLVFRIDLDKDGDPVPESFDRVCGKIRREIACKTGRL
jgi:hypothetical protein